MSRLSRKRRENRTLQSMSVPATRDTRISLDPLDRRSRILIPDLRLADLPERKRFRTVLDVPDNHLRLDMNREVRQSRDIHNYNKIRQAQSKFARAPLAKINLDRSITVDLPPEHPICVRREQRRMVMFAQGKAGKGGGKQRLPRDNNNIKLRCK